MQAPICVQDVSTADGAGEDDRAADVLAGRCTGRRCRAGGAEWVHPAKSFEHIARPGAREHEPARDIPAVPVRSGARAGDRRVPLPERVESAPPVEDVPTHRVTGAGVQRDGAGDVVPGPPRAAVDGRRGSEGVYGTPPVKDVSAVGRVAGIERDAPGDVKAGPPRAVGDLWRSAERLDPAPTVEHVPAGAVRAHHHAAGDVPPLPVRARSDLRRSTEWMDAAPPVEELATGSCHPEGERIHVLVD